MGYFKYEQSAYYYQEDRDDDVLKIIANQFIARNPQEPYTYRTDFISGIKCNEEGQYIFDFANRFTEAKVGDVCFAAGNLYSSSNKESSFQIRCYGPTICKVNGETVYSSDPYEESLREKCVFKVSLKEGLNEFLFSTEKTEVGFGFMCGNTIPQWEPTHFRSPLLERNGQAGFIYSYPSAEHEFPKELSDVKWLPKQSYDKGSPEGPFDRIFGIESTGTVFAKTNIKVPKKETASLHGHTQGKLKAYLNGELCLESDGGNYHKDLILDRGMHTLILQYEKSGNQEKDYTCTLQTKDAKVCPYPTVEGYKGDWLYVGPFTSNLPSIEELSSMNTLYKSGETPLYWRCDLPDGVVRIFAEQELFGKWTYPMGVTLYGLLEAGKWLERKDYIDYVQESVKLTSHVQDYALYDKEVFGYASVNTQLCWLHELDDCGSFGSLMLEATKGSEDPHVKKLADHIANFMRYQQRREADGVFSRPTDTMWIDDMYMSIPFLCRYYQMSGEIYYLEEACRQALLFKKYFFIEEQNLMSHIFFTEFQKANKIPWGRGNGWVVFALTELLHVLPDSSEYYHEIVAFYNQMAEGILDVQGDSGLWHQVLDEVDTYEETSGTAMFICSLSRGYRNGYLKEKLRTQAVASVDLAWEGLKKIAVNRYGDVYGVCRGSGRSYSRSYYKNLSWRFNDEHGIGIVILAGIEKLKLDEHLRSI